MASGVVRPLVLRDFRSAAASDTSPSSPHRGIEARDLASPSAALDRCHQSQALQARVERCPHYSFGR